MTREQITELIQEAIEGLDDVHAAWLAGSAAFGRLDEWSDLDVIVIADDEHVQDVFDHIEAAFARKAPVETVYVAPMPTWHGHAQRFYRLRGTPEFLRIDLVVMQESDPRRFLEPERHGNPVVLFDKRGLVVPAPPGDPAKLQARLQERLEEIRVRIDLFGCFVQKEINRGNAIDALHFYHTFVLRQLVEVLRIRYCPQRYDFGVRYLRHDLPADVVNQLDELFFVHDMADLATKSRRAISLLQSQLAHMPAPG